MARYVLTFVNSKNEKCYFSVLDGGVFTTNRKLAKVFGQWQADGLGRQCAVGSTDEYENFLAHPNHYKFEVAS